MKQPTVAGMTRRRLVAAFGAALGSGLATQALSAGLVSDFQPPDFDRLDRAPRVVILGAGIAGLVSAFELGRAGFDCVIIEARERVGGRSWTVRGGDRFTEIGGASQTCGFDPGHYLNPGPWRIPYHHRGMLHYARRLGVAVQPLIQNNFAAYVRHGDTRRPLAGRNLPQRMLVADYFGRTAEMLASCIDRGMLDDVLDPPLKAAVLAGLRAGGCLDEDYSYRGNVFRGWDVPPGGAGHPPVPSIPFSLRDLFGSNLASWLPEIFDGEHQPTLFEPVGGMDRMPTGFVASPEFKARLRLGREVAEIRQDDNGVRIVHRDAVTGATEVETGDYCFCTIPASVLYRIPADFPTDVRTALAGIPYGAASKVGLQFGRRFWEEDEAIYGGNTYMDGSLRGIAYPSHGFLGAKGVLQAEYDVDTRAALEYSALSPADRVQRALNVANRIHPQALDTFESGFSVAWHRVPYTHGCYGLWSADSRARLMPVLTRPAGRVHFAGEHLSYLPAWQEGALLSGLEATAAIYQRGRLGQ